MLVADLLGQQDPALGRGQLVRRDELDRGQLAQAGRVDPALGAGRGVVPRTTGAEGGLGGAAGGDPLAAGPANQPGRGHGSGQGGQGGRQGRGQGPGAGVGGRPGRRGGQGRGGGQALAGGGVEGDALAGVQALQGGHQVAGLGLGGLAGGDGAGDPADADDLLQPEGRDHVHLDLADRHRPGGPDRVPGQPAAGGDPGQAVADGVAVAAGDGAAGVADPQAGLVGGAGDLHLVGGAVGVDPDRAGRVEAGDVAVDAVALAAGEVVVDDLGDLRRPVAADPGPGPQPGHPLGLGGHHPGHGGQAGQHHHPGQHTHVDAAAPPDPHGRTLARGTILPVEAVAAATIGAQAAKRQPQWIGGRR